MKTKPNSTLRKINAAVAVLVTAFLLFGAATPASASVSLQAAKAAPAAAAVTLAPALATGSSSLPAAAVLVSQSPRAVWVATGQAGALQIRLATKPWAEKVKAFTQCIFAVGVPVGVALSLIGNPAAWRFIIGQGAKPLMVSPGMYAYMIWVKQRCSYAIF